MCVVPRHWQPFLFLLHTMNRMHSLRWWAATVLRFLEYLDYSIRRSAWMWRGIPYVTLNNQWSCDSGTWGRKSWQRSSTPLAFSRTAEAGNILTIIKGYKPCHAAIRPNSWQPISYDINGRTNFSFIIQLCSKKKNMVLEVYSLLQN